MERYIIFSFVLVYGLDLSKDGEGKAFGSPTNGRQYGPTIIYVLNRLLERPIDSMGRARLLDKILSVWARPICSTINRVNAHLLNKLLKFGPERLFNQPHVVSPPNPHKLHRCNPHTLWFYSNFP